MYIIIIIIIIVMSRRQHISSIALSRSSSLHPISAQSCGILVLAGRPVFARPCEGVHRSMSLKISSLFLSQCPACLVRLSWIVSLMGGRWLYSYCFVGCCLHDLLNIAFLCNCRQAFSPYV